MERVLGVGVGEPVREGSTAGERLDALALTVEQKPLEIDPGPARGVGRREVVSK